MCGITGFWQPDEQEVVLQARATAMASTLVHRGPDDSGIWTDPAAGIALGFRRLAILDLSPTGHQPMHSASGRFVTVFNGEIYNYRNLRAELEKHGVRFRGTSDTEVMLAGADLWGIEAIIPRLWGMFALGLWDRQERVLYLARDRLGKKPLYYSEMNGAFLFGSELKALRAHPVFRAEIDREALTAYLRYGYVPVPLSIYRGVCKLPQGTYAIIRAGETPVIRRYWDPRSVVEQGLANPMQIKEAEAVEALETLLKDATARRMIADVPLGALLSGGIDSSVIVALMQAQSARPVRTFTIGFHVSHYNEAEMAKAVAQHLGTVHTELYVTPDEARAIIPRLPRLYDEPFADSSQIPTYLVYELARRHVTVSLSGDGGDELFAGYQRYAYAVNIWRGLRYLPQAARRGLAAAIRSQSPATWDKVYGGLTIWLPPERRRSFPGDKLYKLSELLQVNGPEEIYHRLISLWKVPASLVIDGKEPASILGDPSVRDGIPGFVDRMLFWDLVTYLPDDILVKVDRASMGVSLEARSPLLDHRLVEWVWQLPLRFKVRHGQSKWLLRQVLYKYVPRELVDRPKMGFGVPIDVWLRGPLREWAEALLAESRLRREGFFKPESIRTVWTNHLAGLRNQQHLLWAVLMFQAWHEYWVTR